MYRFDRRKFFKVGVTGAAALAVPGALLGACGPAAVVTPPSEKPKVTGTGYFETEFGISQEMIAQARALTDALKSPANRFAYNELPEEVELVWYKEL